MVLAGTAAECLIWTPNEGFQSAHVAVGTPIFTGEDDVFILYDSSAIRRFAEGSSAK